MKQSYHQALEKSQSNEILNLEHILYKIWVGNRFTIFQSFRILNLRNSIQITHTKDL